MCWKVPRLYILSFVATTRDAAREAVVERYAIPASNVDPIDWVERLPSPRRATTSSAWFLRHAVYAQLATLAPDASSGPARPPTPTD